MRHSRIRSIRPTLEPQNTSPPSTIKKIIACKGEYEEKYSKSIPVIVGGGIFDKRDIERVRDANEQMETLSSAMDDISANAQQITKIAKDIEDIVHFRRHPRQPRRRAAEAKKRFVHGPGDRTQAAADQRKIALVIHLGPGAQISVCNPRQHLLDVRYVPVHAFQGSLPFAGPSGRW